jgi:hypothetical protein
MTTDLYTQCGTDDPQWLRKGASAGFGDLVFFAGKDGGRSFDEAAAQADVVLTGPNASPAYPEELRGFIDPALTRREQFDYSDIASDWFAMRWALNDPQVIYIRNPVSRVIFDQNRARDPDPAASLREHRNPDRRELKGRFAVLCRSRLHSSGHICRPPGFDGAR